MYAYTLVILIKCATPDISNQSDTPWSNVDDAAFSQAKDECGKNTDKQCVKTFYKQTGGKYEVVCGPKRN